MRNKLSPLGEMVFVRKVSQDGELTLEVVGQAKAPGYRGIVVAVGPGEALPSGGFIKPEVRKGDVVYFSASTGVSVAHPSFENLLVMRASDILGVECE